MHIVERPDPQEHLEFLIKAHDSWQWAVFPLHKINRNYNGSRVWCSCRKRLTCPTPGKHPLIRWTERDNYPSAEGIKNFFSEGFTGWGIHLGWSNLCVIDIDPRNGGDQTILQFRSNEGYLSRFPVVTTGGRGDHLYMTAGKHIDQIRGVTSPSGAASTSILLGPGVEFLSGQHFVVAPFSPHKRGGFYAPIFGIDFPTFEGFKDGSDDMGNSATLGVFSEKEREGFVHGWRR